jgi:uncharacterized membrane protein
LWQDPGRDQDGGWDVTDDVADGRVPDSAWLLGWACLAAQVVTLVERGPNNAESALISAPLSALAVGWVSYGVLRARMVRVWIAGIILLLTAIFGFVALVVDPSLLTVAGAVTGVVAFGALLRYVESDCFARLREDPERAGPDFGGLVAIAVVVGVLGGLTLAPGAGDQSSGFNIRIGL